MFLVMAINIEGGLMPRTWDTIVEEQYQEYALKNMFVAGRRRGLGGGVFVFRPQQPTDGSIHMARVMDGCRDAGTGIGWAASQCHAQ